MLIVICIGEASGDSLAASLINNLNKENKNISFIGITGPKMRIVGCKTLYDFQQLAIMGFTDVFKNIFRILRLRYKLIKTIIKLKPCLFIGVDAPDFNLSVENKLHKYGIKTIHYVSPTIWAWRPKRIKTIKKAVDKTLLLYPFEEIIYKKNKVSYAYVGHPLADEIPLIPDTYKAREHLGLPNNKKIITLLPGSRLSEIQYLAEIFLDTAKELLVNNANLIFILPTITEQGYKYIKELIQKKGMEDNVYLNKGESRLAIEAADVVLLASGTATLEAMLFKKPMVVAYKINKINYLFAKTLIKIKHISQPNILANEELVPEYIQDDVTVENLKKAVLFWLDNESEVALLQKRFTTIHQSLKCDHNQRVTKVILDQVCA